MGEGSDDPLARGLRGQRARRYTQGTGLKGKQRRMLLFPAHTHFILDHNKFLLIPLNNNC